MRVPAPSSLPAPTLVLALILLLVASSSALAGDIPLGQPFTLSVGEIVFVSDANIELQFSEVLADGRCPRSVLCFWEGEATVGLHLKSLRGEEAEVELHTLGSPFGDSSAEFSDHVVRFLTLDPYPETLDPIDPADYRLQLVVEAATILPSESSSWSMVKARYR